MFRYLREHGLNILVSACILWVIGHKIGDTSSDQWAALFTLIPNSLPWVLLTIVLIPLNLGCETAKWHILLKKWYPNVSFFQLFKAIFAGISIGILTPNRLGEYAGRLTYIPNGHRTEATAMTFLSRFAQTLPTSIIGTIGLCYLFPLLSTHFPPISANYFFLVLGFVNVGMLVCWLGIKRWNRYFSYYLSSFNWIHRMSEAISFTGKVALMKISYWSFIRYGIFSCQYYLLMSVCGYEGNIIDAWVCISAIFFIKSLVPSIALSEWGIREIVAIEVMNLYDIPIMIALGSTSLLYVFNMILPAIIGTFLIYRKAPSTITAFSTISPSSAHHTPHREGSD